MKPPRNDPREWCDPAVLAEGQVILIADPYSQGDTNNWVEAVAKRAKARVDWHWKDEWVEVLYLGDADGRRRVEEAINELASSFRGIILERLEQWGQKA